MQLNFREKTVFKIVQHA